MLGVTKRLATLCPSSRYCGLGNEMCTGSTVPMKNVQWPAASESEASKTAPLDRSCSSQCASVQLKCDDTWFTGSAPNGSGTATGGASSSDYVYPCSHVFSNVTSTVSCGCTT